MLLTYLGIALLLALLALALFYRLTHP